MIVPQYTIKGSHIDGAGKGLFIDQPLPAGAILTAPDRISRTYTRAELERFADDSMELNSSVRWFEDQHTICPEWTDECYINHSFTPTAIWHLGFVFAAFDLEAGTEITMDYRYVLGTGYSAGFRDGATGEMITGLPWDQVIRDSTALLYTITQASTRRRNSSTRQKSRENRAS